MAIGECQAIEVSKFTHYFWYLITFRTEANQAAAANACAANAAANDAVVMLLLLVMRLVMLLQIVAVMMIVVRMRMRMRMMVMMMAVAVTVTVTMVVIVTVMMLMANSGRALAQCSCIFASAAAIQLLWPLERARLAHLQATLAALLLRRRFALTECIQIGSYKLRLQCLGRRNGCAVIFTSWRRR